VYAKHHIQSYEGLYGFGCGAKGDRVQQQKSFGGLPWTTQRWPGDHPAEA